MFGCKIGDKYLTEYNRINKLYGEDIEKIEKKIRQFDFEKI